MDHNVEAIAKVCHEANRAFCETIGDWSQKEWEVAEDWQRNSAIAGVRTMLDGTARSPREQHEAWCRDKVAAGWVHGEKKDPNAKTHPCLVDYDKLPREQRLKDHLFRAVVEALTADA